MDDKTNSYNSQHFTLEDLAQPAATCSFHLFMHNVLRHFLHTT